LWQDKLEHQQHCPVYFCLPIKSFYCPLQQLFQLLE
jgi:hypothetical protein